MLFNKLNVLCALLMCALIAQSAVNGHWMHLDNDQLPQTHVMHQMDTQHDERHRQGGCDFTECCLMHMCATVDVLVSTVKWIQPSFSNWFIVHYMVQDTTYFSLPHYRPPILS